MVTATRPPEATVWGLVFAPLHDARSFGCGTHWANAGDAPKKAMPAVADNKAARNCAREQELENDLLVIGSNLRLVS
ncbi:MAG: hypothetical protein EOP58_01210 [Sphingomonadales bacterium]|nr:MAG: hypothetical protein EOP58_01210 [Sphingomonadales bacterium]